MQQKELVQKCRLDCGRRKKVSHLAGVGVGAGVWAVESFQHHVHLQKTELAANTTAGTSKISLTGWARVELSRSPSSSITFSMAAVVTPAGMDKHRSHMRHVSTGTLAVSSKRGHCSPSGPHGQQVVLQEAAEALLICGSPSLAFMLPDTLVISTLHCFRNISC